MQRACACIEKPDGFLEIERQRLDRIVEVRQFNFQDNKVLEASRRMDRVILYYYRKNKLD